MIRKLKEEKFKKDYTCFLENFEETDIDLIAFHPFQCPIAIVDAEINEHIIQDYNIFSLLILRLIDAGFTSVKQIASISGMSAETVRNFLTKEIYAFQHITEDLKLTNLGKKTLEENQEGGSETRSHELYQTVIRMNVDAVTGSVIPEYMRPYRLNDVNPEQELGDFILPREDVEIDEDFRSKLIEEINSRITEYVNLDYIPHGNIIDSVNKLTSVRIIYTWAYLAKFDGMNFPMIVLPGKRTISNVNAKSNIENNYDRETCLPLAIAQTDANYLKDNGIVFESIIVRQNKFFEYLYQKTDAMSLTLPNFDTEPVEKTDSADETDSANADTTDAETNGVHESEGNE